MNVEDTLVEVLLADPGAPGISLAGSRGTPDHELSRAEWIERGQCFARRLVELGVEPGDRIALVLPTGLPFFVALLGGWLARASISPLCPPLRGARRPDLEHERIRTLLHAVEPRVVIAVDEVLSAFGENSGAATAIPWLSESEVIEASSSGRAFDSKPQPDDIGLIQFSSGSTGIPKGIVLRHRQIRANVDGIGRRVAVTREDSMVSWLPLHHDMGLIGSICCPLGWRIPVRILPTEMFGARPTLWLAEISQRRGTLCPAPASAFDVVSRLFGSRDVANLDLSCWRYAWVGAEPVFPRVLARFVAAFERHGLRPETLCPSYGLAEATLCATMPTPGRPTRVAWVDVGSLRTTGFAAEANPHAPGAAAFAGNGRALDNLEVEIFGSAGQALGDRHEGRIHIRGASVTDGYRNEPPRPPNGWLDTGDLGFMVDGELFITGRAKDVLIRGGVKFQPHELELVAQQVEGVRVGGAAAFCDLDAVAGREHIVIAIEASRRADAPHELPQRVRLQVAQETGVQVDRVDVVPAGSIPKTTSGKVQRQRARELWRTGAWSGTNRKEGDV